MAKFDPGRAIILSDLVQKTGYPATLKKMFGHDTWFLNGYMYAGCNTGGVFVHLGEDGAKNAIDTNDDVIPFSPRSDMVMRAYVQIADPSARDPQILSEWLKRSAEFLLALPPKVKKKKPKKT